MSESSHIYSKQAARYVFIASAGLVTLLVLYLFVSAVLQHLHFAGYGTNRLISECSYPDCQRLLLESDIQNMRSARVGYALIYRFSLSAAAIVVSLVTIILGSVLMFDRVRSNNDNGAHIQASEMKLMANSTFPGLIMVFFGSVTLSITLLFANYLSPVANIRDLPVFIEDHNAWRNTLGLTAGVMISTASANQTLPRGAASEEGQSENRELGAPRFLLGDPSELQEEGE